MPLHLLDNLSNLTDPASARSVLGLGVGDSPQFASLTVQGTISSSGPITADSTVKVWRGGGQEIGSTAVGYQSLCSNSTGNANTANGYVALYYNDTGSSNTAIGSQALYQNTDGSNNTAIGFGALINNTLGAGNIATGSLALGINATGTFNVATGREALYANSIGNYNVAIGDATLGNITIGDNNTAIGSSAGYTISGGAINDIADNSIYLGANTKALSSGETNQIVIGYDATGIGSNTVTLGNDSIITTALKGNVGIGTTSPNATLTVVGNISASGIVTSPDYTVTGVSGAELSISKSVTTWEFGPAAVTVNTQATTPLGVDFNDTGTKAFVVNATTGALNVFQYNLSTPWTLVTATYSTIFKSVSGADSVPRGIKFSRDGLYMFIVGDTNNSIYRYTLTAPWDLNTVSINPTETLSLVPLVGTLTAPQGVDFSLDGRKMYVANSFNNLIFEFNLVNPWVLTGATYSGNSLNVNAFTGESNVQDVVISSDGTRLIIIGSITERVWEFTLPTPYSLAGAFLHGFMRVSFNGNTNQNMLPVAAFSEGNVSGLYYNDVSNKCFYVGDDTNAIQEIIVKPQILLIGERPIIRATGADLGAGTGAGSVRINRLRITDTTTATSNDGGTYGALTVAGGIGAANITVGGSIVGNSLRVDAAGTLVFNTRSTIVSPIAGIFTFGTAPNLVDCNMLQIGPQGTSYPAIKRNGTGIDIVRSDQTTPNSTPLSGFTDLRARNLTATGTISGGTVTSATNALLVNSSAGTDIRINLGGIDATFPAIKRNGSGLDIVNAADTVGGFTDLRARNITASGTLSGLNLVTGGNALNATGDFSLALSHLGRVIRYSGVAAISATVPDQSTVAWPDGSLIYLRRNAGAGTITIQGSGGTIINDNISTSVPAGSMMAIRRVTTNEWDFI